MRIAQSLSSVFVFALKGAFEILFFFLINFFI
jgi:hypothetical protein